MKETLFRELPRREQLSEEPPPIFAPQALLGMCGMDGFQVICLMFKLP